MRIVDKAKKFLNQNPARLNFGLNEMRKIDYGSTRVVFRITAGPMAGNVIKFPREGEHSKMNEAEVRTWNMAKQRDKTQYLCPVIDYDEKAYSWLIMESAEMGGSYDEERDFRDKIREEFPNQNMDLMGCNIGRHDGDMKLIDYAWR